GDGRSGAVVARLDERVVVGGAPLRVFGYPASRPRGQWAEVRAVDTVEGGRLQLNSLDPTTPDVRSGFSGSPVYDPDTGIVVGLVAEAPVGGHARDSLAIPAAELLAFYSSVAPASVVSSNVVASALAAGPVRRPERVYGPAAELVVLHLSDPQFGENHLFGGNGLTSADRDRDSLFARLHEDLAKLADARGLWPDLVVVTGDLAETGMGSEFDQVVEFLERLVEAVDVPRHRVAVVPGNHDVNRIACQASFLNEQATGQQPVPPYWPKWRHYAAAFEHFYGSGTWSGGGARPLFAPEQPWTLFEMADLRVVVAGLNSTMAESHRDT